MQAVRNEYNSIGVTAYYLKHSENYRNPHESIVCDLLETAENNGYIGKRVLDLCCGSGEVTMALKDYNHTIIGADPYTEEAYRKRTGKEALNLSFKDIAQGKLKGEYDTIICSFALHLCENSMLPVVLYQLSRVSKKLIIITPNKRPDCEKVGWFLIDECIKDRVRMRVLEHYK